MTKRSIEAKIYQFKAGMNEPTKPSACHKKFKKIKS
jgi:hypothetical protein